VEHKNAAEANFVKRFGVIKLERLNTTDKNHLHPSLTFAGGIGRLGKAPQLANCTLIKILQNSSISYILTVFFFNRILKKNCEKQQPT
jgi:hypothetical protein